MLNDELPFNDYFEYFKPDYRLHLPAQKNMENFNSTKELQSTLQKVLNILRKLESVPSTPIYTGQAGTTQIPKPAQDLDEREKIHADAVDAEQRQTAALEGKKASKHDMIAPESHVESDLSAGSSSGMVPSAGGSFAMAKGQMEAAVTAWTTAPSAEADEEGL